MVSESSLGTYFSIISGCAMNFRLFTSTVRSSSGVVVKLMACEARGPGFDSRSRHYDFRYWFSPAPSRDMAERSLKRRNSSKQKPTSTVSQTNEVCIGIVFILPVLSVCLCPITRMSACGHTMS